VRAVQVLSVHAIKHSCHHRHRDIALANDLMVVLMQAHSVTLCIGHVM